MNRVAHELYAEQDGDISKLVLKIETPAIPWAGFIGVQIVLQDKLRSLPEAAYPERDVA